jgi:hypothetical protein
MEEVAAFVRSGKAYVIYRINLICLINLYQDKERQDYYIQA